MPIANRSGWLLCLGTALAALICDFTARNRIYAADKSERAALENHFENEVRPLLAQHCIKCHGTEKQEGGLRLDTLEHMLAGGDSGAAVSPGAIADSLIVSAVRYESVEMPPSGQLAPEQIAAIEKWVEAGAVWPSHGAESGMEIRPKSGISESDKNYWAFRPLTHSAVPDVDVGEFGSATPIDAFIVTELDKQGLAMAPQADRRTLLRRTYFDLVGVPPTAEETLRFLESDDPYAYEKLIDNLLEDVRYGEKWARHWLDLVRYAESDGFNQDAYRNNAYIYRDWVINSLNLDKPYDQFVLEQLAGDELEPNNPRYLAATGYLRHWIYEYNQRDVRTQRTNILNDLTDVTGEVFFGLGMGCARCHDHKFDPILQRDYYRLQASFATFLPQDDLPYAEPDDLSRYRSQLAQWQVATADLRAKIDALEGPVKSNVAKAALEKFPIDVRPLLRKPAQDRDGYEEQIGFLAHQQVLEEWKKLDFTKSLKAEKKNKWESLQQELKKFDHLKPVALTTVMAAGNTTHVPPPTVIPSSTPDPVDPASFEVFGASSLESWEGVQQPRGRRTALAHWINSRDNPLPHRVIVNRIWQYHFGTGLVENASDFGRLGSPPSHPELLDWLATYFLENGRSFKQLHRLILRSAVYQQDSRNEAYSGIGMEKDLANRLLWHFPARRLEAEQIRDALLVCSGKLDRSAGGEASEHESHRRSIYTKIKRNKPNAMLVTFDAPDGNASVARRSVTTTPIQSLLLANFQWPLELATDLADELIRDCSDLSAQIEMAYVRCLQRRPSTSELQRDLAFMNHLLSEQSAENPEQPPQATRDGLASLCHVLFNSSEFLYVD
jgi:mono/diheme cytochrome c family protein